MNKEFIKERIIIKEKQTTLELKSIVTKSSLDRISSRF